MRLRHDHAIGGLGLSIIYGFTGQFSLGHAAFVGIGAYTAGLFSHHFQTLRHPRPILGSLVVGGRSPALVGFLIGVPILRLQVGLPGHRHPGLRLYRQRRFAEFRQAGPPPVGGSRGMTGDPHFRTLGWYFGGAVSSVILCRNFVFSTHGGPVRRSGRTRWPRTWWDQPGQDKMMAFTMGCALAGLAGALYAHNIPSCIPILQLPEIHRRT